MSIEQEFMSTLARIRPRNLQQFCGLYFYTYVKPNKQLTEAHSRTPRTPPGLKAIKETLKCSEGKALDLLRTIHLTRQYFAQGFDTHEPEAQMRILPRKEDLEKLLAMSLYDYGISSIPPNVGYYLSILIKALNYAHDSLPDKESKKREVTKRMEELSKSIVSGIETDFKNVPHSHLEPMEFQVIAGGQRGSRNVKPKDTTIRIITSQASEEKYRKNHQNKSQLKRRLDPSICKLMDE